MSLEYFLKRLFALFLFLSVFIVQYSFAQGTGTLRGTIIDGTTKEGLPGANVVVVGTSNGAASDLDGNFVIYGVPSGNQLIVVSYIGYLPDTLEVNISAGKTITKEISLSGTVVQGKEVLVTGQAVGQLQAINQQLASDKISSVVSEQRIQELPDFNAAQALSRLPGVSTTQSSGEANKVVIRGLAPQYNQITVGGISLASTGSTQIGITSQGGTAGVISNDRSVDLSIVSPYMLKTISVYKSLTPDLNADAIGGVVNLELREAPSELHTDLLFQSGYTQKSSKYGNYRAVASISTRFLDDLFGVYLLGNLESYDRDADNMNASYNTISAYPDESGYRTVRVNTVTLNRHFETRKRYGGNLILDYRLPSGSIKLVNMFSRLNSNYQDFNTLYDYFGLTNELIFRYREGDNNVDLALNSLNFNYDLGFVSVDLKAANNYSRNNLPESPQSEFFQTRGVQNSPINTVPEDLTSQIQYGGPNNTYLRTITLFSSDYKENGQIYRGDLKFPINLGSSFAGYFKLGGEYKYSQHKNAQNTPYATIGGTNTIQQGITDGILQRYPYLIYDSGLARFPATSFTTDDSDILKSFLGDRFGSVLWANNPSLFVDIAKFIANDPRFNADNSSATEPGGWFNGYFQTLPNKYKYIEKYYGGYLMSELNYSDLMIVGGIRYEKVKTLYEAYIILDGRDTKSQTFIPKTVYPDNEFWLPMVQARYKVTDWFDVRAAYTQTLARPDYHQLSPHYTISYGQGTVRAGNPNLKPAQAYNHDLIFTFYNNELGLFSVGGFYKEIKHFTYSTQYPLYDEGAEGIANRNDFNIGGTLPNRGATLFTYINSPYIAYVRGVEFDLQTRFWYLPFPFNGIVLGINYSHISSSATYPWRNSRTRFIPPSPEFPRGTSVEEVFDSTRTGRLIQQPDNLLNASIGYDYGDFSARLSFLFQGNSVSYIGNFPEQDGFSRDFFRMDASVRQVLPWYGIEVFLDLFNINNENNTSAQQSINGFTNEQNYGLTGNLGVRYRL